MSFPMQSEKHYPFSLIYKTHSKVAQPYSAWTAISSNQISLRFADIFTLSQGQGHWKWHRMAEVNSIISWGKVCVNGWKIACNVQH